jgi:chromosome segregation ATPase
MENLKTFSYSTHRIEIDYFQLPRSLKDISVSDTEKLKQVSENLQEELRSKIYKSNQKSFEKAQEKLNLANEKFQSLKAIADDAKKAFKKVSKNRLERFNKCLTTLSASIGGIFKALARDGVTAVNLAPRVAEENEITDVNYNIIMRGRNLKPIIELRSGEKTIGIMALRFAIAR